MSMTFLQDLKQLVEDDLAKHMGRRIYNNHLWTCLLVDFLLIQLVVGPFTVCIWRGAWEYTYLPEPGVSEGATTLSEKGTSTEQPHYTSNLVSFVSLKPSEYVVDSFQPSVPWHKPLSSHSVQRTSIGSRKIPSNVLIY